MSKISVCIPTYNGARYLGACLDSVLSQTFKDIEILVVDDGSTDDTLEILERYAVSDQRIRLHRNDSNLGLVGNWNRCIELARGEWIKFVFQDDLIAPACVEEMLGAATQDAWLIVCRRDFIFEGGSTEETRQFYEQHINPERLFGEGSSYIPPEEICHAAIKLFGVNFFGEPTATLIRREAFARYGLFNPGLAMICDTEYWVRVAVHHGFTYLPKTLASFRVHGGSTSAHLFARRKYRITLDGVILMNEYVNNPTFEPIRAAMRRRHPPVNLNAMLEKKIVGVRSIAINAAKNASSPNPSLLQEWEGLVIRHPNLGHSSRAKTSLWKRLSGLWTRQQ
jgi:glycosyltransferase involved in cell wall biosynthesis